MDALMKEWRIKFEVANNVGYSQVEFLRNKYYKHVENILNVSPKIDNSAPKVSAKLRLLDDHNALCYIDYINKALVDKIHQINRTSGKVDCWRQEQPISKIGYLKRVDEYKIIAKTNAYILARIIGAVSKYPTKEFDEEWIKIKAHMLTMQSFPPAEKNAEEILFKKSPRFTFKKFEKLFIPKPVSPYKMRNSERSLLVPEVLADPLSEALDRTSSRRIGLISQILSMKCWKVLQGVLPARVFFEIRVENDRKLGRIEFELYGEYAPKTVLCFVRLCTGQDKITYKGCPFHRIISGIMCQGGDVTDFNGSGGMTMYGEIFNKENFKLKHGGTGVLSMTSIVPRQQSSQFNITFNELHTLDGKCVVIGKVIKGIGTLYQIEGFGTKSGKPLRNVYIEDCGIV